MILWSFSGQPDHRRLAIMVTASAWAHLALFALLFLIPGSAPRQVGLRFIEARIVPGVPMSPLPKGTAKAVIPEVKEPEKAAPEIKVKPENKQMPLPVKTPTKMQKEEEKVHKPHTIDSAIERIRQKKLNEQLGDPEGEPGTQPYPGMGGVQDRLLNMYLAKLKTKVELNWVRPLGIPKTAAVKVRIFFRLDSSGGVVNPRLEKSSGYASADRSAMSALKKAAPFDPPPQSIGSALHREGIALIFELNQ